jgi:hypothetical protein
MSNGMGISSSSSICEKVIDLSESIRRILLRAGCFIKLNMVEYVSSVPSVEPEISTTIDVIIICNSKYQLSLEIGG